MHYGMDFSAPTGTEIFATGDGEVIMAKRTWNGFGRHVIIRHGFGYETLYAHMSEIKIRKGQKGQTRRCHWTGGVDWNLGSAALTL